MFLIGELINCTRKKVRAAAESRDAAHIKEVAVKQAQAGASMLDVNGGIPGQEVECLAWLVKVVQEVTDLPLCLDSADPEALRAALKLTKQPPMINSITDERVRYEALLPVVKEHKLRVIALCMSEGGTPATVEDKVSTAARLVDRLTGEGIPAENIFVDPCVLPVSTGPDYGKAVVDAVGEITARYPGVHTSVGLSNVSFGVPARKLLNQIFLMLLMARGLDAAIVDPCDQQLMRNILAAEALLGRDEFCMNYVRAYREGKLEAEGVQKPA